MSGTLPCPQPKHGQPSPAKTVHMTPFRFIDLPPELRLMIYRYMPADVANNWDSSQKQLLHPILDVSQQIRHEASPVLIRWVCFLWFDYNKLAIHSIRHGYHPTEYSARRHRGWTNLSTFWKSGVYNTWGEHFRQFEICIRCQHAEVRLTMIRDKGIWHHETSLHSKHPFLDEQIFEELVRRKLDDGVLMKKVSKTWVDEIRRDVEIGCELAYNFHEN